MRGGKVVGSRTEDDIKNPYMVDAAEYRSMVLNRWKSEALDKEESEGFESGKHNPITHILCLCGYVSCLGTGIMCILVKNP